MPNDVNQYADKDPQRKSNSLNDKVFQKKSPPSFQSQRSFIDNRPEAALQRKYQEMVNNSPQAAHMAQRQSMADHHAAKQAIQKVDTHINTRTGLADNLKSGMESLSGMNLNHVKVHYNSAKPAVVQTFTPVQDGEGDSNVFRGKPLVQSIENRNGKVNSPIQMVPKNRHEYRTIVGFYNHNDELENNSRAKKLIGDLKTYSELPELAESPRLIEAIKQQLNNPDVIDELKSLTIANPKSKAQKLRWAFIKQHLENATTDEQNEYKGWGTRWLHRATKYGAIPEATLAVQSAMQFGMGNPVSGGAFLARGALFELKLALTHGISLKRKMDFPNGWKRIITSVSILAEVAKFFETWTPSGLLPKAGALDLANASNYIKKIRASVMGLKELPKLCFDYDLAPVDKMINASVGEVENVLNFINIGIQLGDNKPDKNIIDNIINNIAKLIRHLVDLVRLLIGICKKKPKPSETSQSSQRPDIGSGGGRTDHIAIPIPVLDPQSTSINRERGGSVSSNLSSPLLSKF